MTNVPASLPSFAAYRLTTQKTAWRGISWLRGSWRLQGPGRSCRQPKAGLQISTAERSAAARSMRRGSRALTLVGAHTYTCSDTVMWAIFHNHLLRLETSLFEFWWIVIIEILLQGPVDFLTSFNTLKAVKSLNYSLSLCSDTFCPTASTLEYEEKQFYEMKNIIIQNYHITKQDLLYFTH